MANTKRKSANTFAIIFFNLIFLSFPPDVGGGMSRLRPPTGDRGTVPQGSFLLPGRSQSLRRHQSLQKAQNVQVCM